MHSWHAKFKVALASTAGPQQCLQIIQRSNTRWPIFQSTGGNIGATTTVTEGDSSASTSELGGTSHALVPRNFRDVFLPVNEATLVTKLNSIAKFEDRSEAAALLCCGRSPRQAQGIVQRSGFMVYPEQFGLHTGSGKFMSDAPPKPPGGRGRK